MKLDENKNVLHVDANNLHGQSISQPLPYNEIKFDKSVKLDDILNKTDDSDILYFVEVDLSFPDIIEEKLKHFPFAPENKIVNSDNFTTYMKKKQIKILYTN